MYDNIVFDQRATVECTGRSGVLDLMAEFGLTEQQALEVSDHCPVWAEFNVYEGYKGAPVTGRPGELPRY
jgi:deoxyribonuclease-1-like protein